MRQLGADPSPACTCNCASVIRPSYVALCHFVVYKQAVHRRDVARCKCTRHLGPFEEGRVHALDVHYCSLRRACRIARVCGQVNDKIVSIVDSRHEHATRRRVLLVGVTLRYSAYACDWLNKCVHPESKPRDVPTGSGTALESVWW
jgi:hypothetical protein